LSQASEESDGLAPGAPGALSAQQILRILPHRYPMLLIDRVLAVEPGKRLSAVKCVSMNEPFFPGHFPEGPIMPGVLIVEAMAQAAGILAHASEPFDPSAKVLLFLGIDGARFRRPVVPGDRLEITVELLHSRRGVWKVDGQATVEGRRVAEAQLLVAVSDRLQG
jgi:3-hydroxyacyl-[acyl-carrier-protein] dehydratase